MTKVALTIGDVEPFSIVDFPDHIAAVVFLQGCPLRCPFCYNKSLQPLKSTDSYAPSFDKLLTLLQKRKNMLDAVVFSGGEPLLQQDLPLALQTVKQMGYQTGLHTSGCLPEALEKALPFLDWVGLDIKAPLEDTAYQKATGVLISTDKIKKSLDLLLASKTDFECRTTCDPLFLTTNDLHQIAQTLKQKGVQKYYLQKYRAIEDFLKPAEDKSEQMISDPALIDFLKSSFQTFDVRK